MTTTEWYFRQECSCGSGARGCS